jgi:hypothetical protein
MDTITAPEDEGNGNGKNIQRRPAKPALPVDYQALSNSYKLKTARSLNDQVETYFRKLFENPKFKGYIDEIFDDESKTGKLAYDDLRATDMIIEAAKADGNNYIVSHKEAQIVRALRVVMNRFGLSRQARRSDSEGVDA